MEALVSFRGVNVSLDGRRVLSALDWELGEGENHVLLGQNGCGKTTFLRLIRGELAPDPGGGERCYRIGARVSASPVFARDKIAFVSPEIGAVSLVGMGSHSLRCDSDRIPKHGLFV